MSSVDQSGPPRPPSSYEYVEGWGMAVGAPARVLRPRTVEEVQAVFELARREGVSVGLRGAGCSYGDASVNEGGHVLDITRLNKVLHFDPQTGLADLEAGVTLETLWKRTLPEGWWPLVVAGTMYPSVAGCAAMNIHGKNNFKVGTFGDAVQEFDIVLPAGELRTCSRERDADLFHAAIGSFGMLGCITRVKIQTKRVYSGDLEVKGVSVQGLDEMMGYFEAERENADYLVGWVDCFAGEDDLGRGLHQRRDGVHPLAARPRGRRLRGRWGDGLLRAPVGLGSRGGGENRRDRSPAGRPPARTARGKAGKATQAMSETSSWSH